MSVLSEYENYPELHIKILKVKQQQLTTLTRVFSKKDEFTENKENSNELLEKIKAKLQEYKDEYPEYFI